MKKYNLVSLRLCANQYTRYYALSNIIKQFSAHTNKDARYKADDIIYPLYLGEPLLFCKSDEKSITYEAVMSDKYADVTIRRLYIADEDIISVHSHYHRIKKCDGTYHYPLDKHIRYIALIDITDKTEK